MTSTEQVTEDNKSLGIKPAQVIAYALAAITAAVLGSFFGFSGSLIGAGLASVISTVGAALYERAVEKAHLKTKEAAKRAIRNTGALRAQPQQRQGAAQQGLSQQGSTQQQRPPQQGAPQQGAPQQRPPQQQGSAQQRPVPPGQRPGHPPTGSLRRPPDRATTSRAYRPVDPAEQIANLATPLGEQRTRQMNPATQRVQQHRPPVTEADSVPAPAAPWWRRNLKLLIGLTVLVFVIGVAGVSGVELLNGGPLSGGSGGTSVGRVLTGNTGGHQDETPQDQQGGETTDGPETTGQTAPATTEETGETGPATTEGQTYEAPQQTGEAPQPQGRNAEPTPTP